jgi:hypothetical protein
VASGTDLSLVTPSNSYKDYSANIVPNRGRLKVQGTGHKAKTMRKLLFSLYLASL